MQNPSNLDSAKPAFHPLVTQSVVGRPKPTASRRSGGRSRTPFNPGLYQLVDGKQVWADPLEEQAKAQGFLGWHQRGYLPHRDIPGLTQFVTFRLHESFPSARRAEWQALLQIEDNRRRRTRLEEYLDKGHGPCWLSQQPIADLAEGALRYFHPVRYQLLAWVIMPNHIHVLVRVCQRPLAQIVQSWKGFIAREANKILKREGSFWEREYWDTYMRDADQVISARRYIEQNPVKARLVTDSKAWPWSSASFPDPDALPPAAPTLSRLKPQHNPSAANHGKPAEPG